MCGIWVAFLAGDRGDVDDASVVLLDHRRHDRLAADEGSVEIDAQHFAPFLDIGFPHRLVDAGNSGVVDENVDLAERLERSVPRLLDGRKIRNVDLKSADRLADLLCGFFGQGLVMVPDRDLRTGCDETLRNRPPKTLGAACNDGAPAV